MSNEKKVGASVRVTVTMEISLRDAWGTGTTIEQIQRQAVDSAQGELRRAFQNCENHNGCRYSPPAVRVIQMKPTVVLVEETPA